MNIPIHGYDALRIGYAFELIRMANSVSICSLEEMEKIVLRALGGEFDQDILIGPQRKPLSEVQP